MSSALVWIILPFLFGLSLILFRRWGRLALFASTALAFLLTWMAWQLPINEPLRFGPFDFRIAETLNIFGRNFTLGAAELPLVTFVYILATAWLLGAFLAQPGPLFPPVMLMTIAILLAALAVEPFLYAALLIALAALICVPLLNPPGSTQSGAVLRFLIFQLFGVPFILFSGWLLTGIEASPGNLNLVVRAGMFLAFGFLFMMAVFPFHSWIPGLGEHSHPYNAAFVFLVFPAFVGLFTLGMMDRYVFLRSTPLVFQLLMSVGAVTALLGGLWSLFEEHLGRQLGFAVVMEIGVSLLALSLGDGESVHFYFALLIPRTLAYLVWAIALSGLRESSGSLKLADQDMVARIHPLLLASMAIAVFSLVGLPLLAGFLPRFALWRELAASSAAAASLAILGSLALLLGVLRNLYRMVMASLPAGSASQDWLASAADGALPDLANPYAWALLLLGGGGLLLMGILPQSFLSALAQFAAIFPQLSQ
jgi:formate hydrogenlyase subunit 3/multisubunit Na+/H+ antiporter MnhD subunit